MITKSDFQYLSIIIPIYNEEKSIKKLVEEIEWVFKKNKLEGEIIIVNDGSTDKSAEIVNSLSNKKPNIKVFHHRINLGKSKALETGFNNSKGNIFFMIDSDLQHTSKDIPKFVKKINEGYDIVNGWRKNRKDGFFKKLSSKTFNRLSCKLFNLNIHDLNCGYKAIRKEVLDEIKLKKDFHRYLIPIAISKGFKVSEVEVEHFPRPYGKSKYGTIRLLTGFLDMLTLKLYLSFSERPMFLFGSLGMFSFVTGFFIGLYMVFLRFQGVAISGRPALFLSILLIVIGVQFIMMGFLSERINEIKIK